MDCVTCILVGMCVMCGPGIGAKSPGRPLTEAELNQAMEGLLRHYRPVKRPPAVSYSRRQSFIPDVRFTDIGIGKRNHLIDRSVHVPEGQEDDDQSHPSIQTPSLNGNEPLSENKMAEVLIWPLIAQEIEKMQQGHLNDNGNSFQRGPGEVSLSKDRNSAGTPRGESIGTILKRLKRSKLEQLLLKKISEGKRLTGELINVEREIDEVDSDNTDVLL